MKVSIDSDVTKNTLQEVSGLFCGRLYVDRYEPCLFQDRLPDMPNQKGNVSGSDDGEVEERIHEMHDSYASFFPLQFEHNIAVCATEYYTKALHCYWDAVSEELEVYCKGTGQEELHSRLSKIVSEVGAF